MKSKDIIRNVWIKKGPDVMYYDLYFEESQIRLAYLGSIWAVFRPRTGLPKIEAVVTYKLLKQRRRQRNDVSKDDIIVPYDSIREYRLRKIVEYRPYRGADKRLISSLELKLRNGKFIQIYFSSKVYDKMKALLKKHIVK